MTVTSHLAQSQRFANVDGLRAYAILWVVLYHYSYFWTPAGAGLDLLPYGAQLSWLPLAQFGEFWVYLFFIISAYLITLSLESAANIWQFAAKRLIRLWPTLFICGTLTFVITGAYGPEELTRSVAEYAISMTFVPPSYVDAIVGVSNWEWLDGAYWSLWVEVRFYALAAALFFVFPRFFVQTWTLFFIFALALTSFASPLADIFERVFFVECLPFFSFGIAMVARAQPGNSLLAMVLAVGSIFAVFNNTDFAAHDSPLQLALCYFLVFVVSYVGITSNRPIKVLAAKPMVLIGRSSYAYYLLHQNIGIALTLVFASALGAIGAMLAVQVGILAFSILLTLVVEEPLRKALMRRLRRRGSKKPSTNASYARSHAT
ncbi:MAG: acyltransferase [Rhodobacteraceae bacterium]|nr:acyltransferase [Paracoccaceae bacterium]